jgi:hypothetical protein
MSYFFFFVIRGIAGITSAIPSAAGSLDYSAASADAARSPANGPFAFHIGSSAYLSEYSRKK